MTTHDFLILDAVLTSVLVIQQPFYTKEIFICFSGASKDDSPTEWRKMSTRETLFSTSRYMAQIPESAKKYRLRVKLQDNSIIESKWKLLKDFSDKCPKEDSSILGTLFYITLGGILALSLLICCF
jgi:hypothetical protein